MIKKFRYLSLSLFFILSACGGLSSSNDPDPIPSAAPLQFDFDEKMTLALGGTLPGWDEVVVSHIAPTDQVVLEMIPRENISATVVDATNDSLTFKIHPELPGIALIRYRVNDVLQDKNIKVIVPPQEMIQVLMGEARSIIPQESTLTSEGLVDRHSSSFTAQALLSVVRNRIKLIEERNEASLFVVDEEAFSEADLAQRYRLVIQANQNGIYQFSPVDPNDPSFEAYTAASQRGGLSDSRLIVYDQALLTAANIFDESLADNTFESFGFYSPTQSQYENLLSGLGSSELPEGIGRSDDTFPTLAPIQILILNEISPQTFDANLPSFVFVKSRTATENAVIRL